MIGPKDLYELANMIDGGDLTPLERSTVATALRRIAECLDGMSDRIVALESEVESLAPGRVPGTVIKRESRYSI